MEEYAKIQYILTTLALKVNSIYIPVSQFTMLNQREKIITLLI